MDGLNNNFINKYKEFIGNEKNSVSGNKLSPDEIQKLEQMVSSGQIDPAAAAKLKEEIIKDGISPEERKLLLAIGHSITDSTKLNQFKQALDSDPVNGQIANLINTGFETRKSEIARESAGSPIESFFRNLGDKTGVTAAYNATYGRIYGTVNTSEQEAAEETRTLISANAPVFNNSVEDVDCIKDSLSAIAARNPGIFKLGDVPTRAVSQVFLMQATNKIWDGINIKESNDLGHLKNVLNKDQEGKALIVVGAHTFVFEGFDDEGKLKVTDPSDGNKPRTIDKDNPAASAFVLGYGDGIETRALNKGSDTSNLQEMVKPYKDINAKMNSADKDNEESLNIRKLLSLMGDSTQKTAFNDIKKLVNSGNVAGLKNYLSNKGIKLDSDELANMIVKMKAPIIVNGQTTNMLNQLENLQNSPANDKTRYQFGIQYSDVNLKDFFTRTSAGAMNEVFQDMIAGRDGC